MVSCDFWRKFSATFGMKAILAVFLALFSASAFFSRKLRFFTKKIW